MPEEESERKAIDIYEMLAVVFEQLDAVSWIKLGLRPDIMTGQLHQDLTQARVSIDAMAKIMEVLEPALDEDDKRRLQGMVRDLRINWVERNKEVGS